MLRRSVFRLGRLGALSIVLLALLLASCQSTDGVEPDEYPGQVTCAGLDGGYAGVAALPEDGLYGPGAGLSVAITQELLDPLGSGIPEYLNTFTWSSTFGVDAVIVYSATVEGSNLYRYDPEDFGDGGLSGPFEFDLVELDITSPFPPPITSIEFCYDSGLTVVKQANPEDDTPFYFQCARGPLGAAAVADCGNFPPLQDPSANSWHTPLDVHQITELVPDGWTLDHISCDADPQFWHSEGNTLFVEPYCVNGLARQSECVPPTDMICTFYNTRPQGNIVVEKVTSPVDAPATTFGFEASFGDFSLGGGESHDSGLLPAGVYSVAEVLPSAEGWSLASAFCSDGSSPAAIGVSPGETVTCTFTNRYQPPEEEPSGSLTILKMTSPAGGTGFSFDAGTLGGFTLDHGGSQLFDGLAAGEYTVIESPAAGWEFEAVSCYTAPGALVDYEVVSSGVTVDLAEGQDVTCRFTNREGETVGPEGSLTILKHTVPAGGTGFAFDAGSLGSFTLDDGGMETFTDLAAGAYVVSETPAVDWEFASIDCDALDYDVDGASVTVNLVEGEVAVCTFTNGELPYTGSSSWLPVLLAGLATVLMGLGAWVFGLLRRAEA
jgi:LPXTG-motif cell wall-anchored protein